MKLYFSGREYVHKVLVVASEAGVLDRLTYETENPFDQNAPIWQINPLGRHPVLLLDNGLLLNHGLLVCEYLDSLSKGRRLFPQDETRWKALSQMFLGDGVFDASSALMTQFLRPADERSIHDMPRHRERILRGLAAMERDVEEFKSGDFHIGHVCFAGGLSFFDLRRPLARLALEAGDASFNWRNEHPRLSSWYDKIIERPSLKLRPSHLGIVPQEAAKL